MQIYLQILSNDTNVNELVTFAMTFIIEIAIFVPRGHQVIGLSVCHPFVCPFVFLSAYKVQYLKFGW